MDPPHLNRHTIATKSPSPATPTGPEALLVSSMGSGFYASRAFPSDARPARKT